MSKWVRGRLGRPIASMISVLMLVSLLLPMTTPPAQAQLISPADLNKFFEKDFKKPTQMIVLDFTNRSSYATGMLGRLVADALSIELTSTRTFEVIKRSEVERVLSEFGLTLPLSTQAQAMLANRLNCSYVLSGDIDNVQVVSGREGTYAEVQVSAIVIHKVTQMPINGAQVVVRSSPKIAYSGNKDVLVHEALTIAAYQVTQKIMDNRLPIATVLNTPREGQVILRGGSTLGFRKGMILTTVRRESVTGRVRLTLINPAESYGDVLEDSKGIAPGDKGVPIFEYSYSPRVTKEIRERAGHQIAALLMLAGLGVLVGTENGNKELRTGIPAPTAAALADAYDKREIDGANYIRWPSQGERVVAYIIWRDTNSFAPIAVVKGNQTWYIDSAKPLEEIDSVMESVEVTVDLEQESGEITSFEWNSTFETDYLELRNPELQIDEATYSVTCRRVPLQPGERVGYQVQALFMDYRIEGLGEGSLSHPDQYRLYLGEPGPVSQQVTLTVPPTLLYPDINELPTLNIFKCEQVPAVLNYTLQVSVDDPAFAPGSLLPLRNVQIHAVGTQEVLANYPLAQLYSEVNDWLIQHNRPPLTRDIPIYWRMGGRASGDPLPTGQSNTKNQMGWVFSGDRYFMLPPPLPPNPMVRSGSQSGGLMKKTPESTRSVNGRKRLLQRN